MYQVQLTDEERYDDRGCEAIHDVDLILPEYYEDREGPTKNSKLGLSHQVEESLCKLRIEKGEQHGERERVLRVVAQGEVRTEAQRCAIYSAGERNAKVTRQYLRVVAQGEVQTEAQRCAIY